MHLVSVNGGLENCWLTIFFFSEMCYTIAWYDYEFLICLLSFYIFQLIAMQKDMEKHLGTLISAPLAKEGKRIETSLGRIMEKSVKANIDVLWARVQEENTKREKAERERMQQFATLVTSSINKDFPATLEKSLKKEISSLGPAVSRAITPIIEKCLVSTVSDTVQVVTFFALLTRYI
jgi:Skp family chaperone for outer membrane proteins